MKIYTRADWSARPSKSGFALQNPNSVKEVFIHHSASFGARINTLAGQIAAVQQIQNFHMDVRGWDDIAYHFIVFQPYGALTRARIFAGRPTNVVPAAQLDHNSNTVAICIVQADPETLKLNTIWRVGRLARRIRSASRLRGHYEVTGTECPGTVIRAKLDNIAKIAGKSR